MVSTSIQSHDMSHDISSGDISSSSQVISQHLVDFKSIEELQEQNQRLLQVVRDLGEQNEERERQTIEDQTKVMKKSVKSRHCHVYQVEIELLCCCQVQCM